MSSLIIIITTIKLNYQKLKKLYFNKSFLIFLKRYIMKNQKKKIFFSKKVFYYYSLLFAMLLLLLF